MINIRESREVVFDINDLFPEVVILLKETQQTSFANEGKVLASTRYLGG